VQRALRAPYVTGALFMATAPFRLLPELRSALPSTRALLTFIASHLVRIVRAPMSPSRAARRMRWMRAHTFADQRTITAPTLIITGEPGRDRVVPVEDTRRMATRIAGARCEVLPRTGHVGLETRPAAYAELIHRFLMTTTPAA
jgi:pimeloyl-ACP methyl ester carboxylesterase